jgi:transposase
MTLPQGSERWVIVRTSASEQRAQMTLHRQVSRAQASWERKCWHLGTRRFACEADARAALERELKGKPTWLEVHSDIVAHPRHAGKGRPRKDASPATHQWQIVTTVSINQQRVDEEALRKACFIVGTNVLDPEELSDQELVTTYKEQGGVERGFRFLKDPLFLASSVFVKKPERIIALSLIIVLGNLSLMSFSSRAARYFSGDLRKRCCMRRALWRLFSSPRKARHRARSVGQSSTPEKECKREATEATIRTAPRTTRPGDACFRPLARRS